MLPTADDDTKLPAEALMPRRSERTKAHYNKEMGIEKLGQMPISMSIRQSLQAKFSVATAAARREGQ